MAINISRKDLDSIFEEYAQKRDIRESIEVEFDDLNEPAALEVLRIMDNKPDTASLIAIAESMCDGHVITFKYEGKKIKSIAYNKGAGNSLAHLLSKEVYLVDVLASVTYALILKKLTPHLEDSN